MNPLKEIDQNFLYHATKIPQISAEMVVTQMENLSFIDSGLSCDTFNIFHIYDGPKTSYQDIERVLQYYKARQLDYCLWISKENLTKQLHHYFKRCSLQQQNMEVGMMLDLDHYTTIASQRHQHIIQVSNAAQLQDYAGVIAANWSPPDQNILKYYEKTASHYLNSLNKVILLTYYDGITPQSTLEMFPTNEDTIGLYGLATLEDARGQGIGSAMMTKALNLAKSLHYKRVVLQASEDGLNIYKKIGFEALTEYYEFS